MIMISRQDRLVQVFRLGPPVYSPALQEAGFRLLVFETSVFRALPDLQSGSPIREFVIPPLSASAGNSARLVNEC
jgi:hypothetical protein